jgi:hypothetical protein
MKAVASANANLTVLRQSAEQGQRAMCGGQG